MNKYDVIVFDVDGTLVDSDLALVKVGLEMAKIYNVRDNVSMDDYLHLNGPSLDESMPYLFPGYPLQELKETYYSLAPQSVNDMTLFPATKQTLDALKPSHVLAIFTSRGRLSIETLIKKFHLEGYFSFIVCGDDGFAKKPSGDGLRHIAKLAHQPVSSLLFVGDNWRDVDAGKDAKVDTVFINPSRRLTTLKSKPTYVINNIEELKEVIK